MFAHQVIEDLKRYDEKICPLKNFFIDNIIISQKFHMGDINSIRNATQSLENKPLFENELELPYDILWFDVFTPNWRDVSCLGVLLYYNKENRLVIHQFGKSKKDHLWVAPPVWTEFTIGSSTVKYGSTKDTFLNKDFIELMGLNIGASLAEASLLLLTCKNITTETILPPEKLNIKRRKNGKQELFSYHVLNVTLPSQKQGYREKTDPNYHVRVHLCRGHFKEYTNEHPLFGSLTGRYWWQPHVRGQNHNGVVMKDYEVKQRAVA